MPAQAVLGKVVVVAGLADIDVGEQAQAGRPVEPSGRDADDVSFGGIPEEARSARAAEPAPRPAVAVATLDPAQAAALEQHAVAEHDVAERSPQLVADR